MFISSIVLKYAVKCTRSRNITKLRLSERPQHDTKDTYKTLLAKEQIIFKDRMESAHLFLVIQPKDLMLRG